MTSPFICYHTLFRFHSTPTHTRIYIHLLLPISSRPSCGISLERGKKHVYIKMTNDAECIRRLIRKILSVFIKGAVFWKVFNKMNKNPHHPLCRDTNNISFDVITFICQCIQNLNWIFFSCTQQHKEIKSNQIK